MCVLHDARVRKQASWLEGMPDIYHDALGPALFEPYAGDLAARVAILSPDRILELAAGTGIVTAELVKALPLADIVATDLNPAMVAWAKAHVAGPAWMEADAQRLDFQPASFEVVVSQFGVMFFPDKPAAFAEAARVLVPGGHLIFTVWDVVEASDFPAAMTQSLQAVLPDDPPDFITRVPHGYCDEVQIDLDLRSGGLRTHGIEEVRRWGRAASAQELTEGFCLGTPLRFALEERGALPELTSALVREMTTRLGSGPVEGGLTALVITAQK